MVKHFKALQHWFLAPLALDVEAERQAHFLIGCALLSAAFSVFMGAVRVLFYARASLGVVLLCSAFFLLCVPLLLRWTRAVFLSGFILFFIGCVTLFSMVLLDGGFFSGAAYWWPLLSLVGVFLLGGRGALLVTGVLVCGAVVLLVLHTGTTFFPPRPRKELFFVFAGLVNATLFTGFIAWLYDRKRSRAEQLLQQHQMFKDEFVAVVSHELRTPLTSIQGALSILVNASTLKGTINQEQLITLAHRNATRLSLLIDDLLDLQKLELSQMPFHIERIPVGELASSSVEENEALALQAGVVLSLAQPLPEAMVDVDAKRFQQAISNIISNAIKYSPREGVVTIGVKVDGAKACFSVADQGSGIPKDFQARVFDKFAQSESALTRKVGGSGLGLSISRQMIEAMDGTISFDSGEMGTTFLVRFDAYTGKS